MPSLYLPLRARRPRVAFCAATFLVFLVTTVFYAIRGIPYRRSVAPEPVRVPSYGYPHAPVPTGVPMPVSVTAPYIKNGTADVGTAGPGDAAGNATLGVSLFFAPAPAHFSFFFPSPFISLLHPFLLSLSRSVQTG